MLRRKGFRWILIGLLLTATSLSAFGWRRVYRYPRHFVLHPGRPAVAFYAAPPVLRGNWGEVDFDIKPNKSLVYVDGVLLGKADEFDGWPATAHLMAGRHNVRVVSPSGHVYETPIFVQPGRELNFDYRFY
jgi:hypothetical protein